MTTLKSPHPLPPETAIGRVHLTVSDLNRAVDFYHDVLGFQEISREDGVAQLGAGGSELLRLSENPSAKPAPGHTGLYHFAILVPSRRRLGASLQHLIETQYPIQGAADHLVSEAIYLPDPDGNGIELYRDRDRDKWPTRDGGLHMGNAPLDYQSLMAAHQADHDPWSGLHADTIIGHIHLHVADIPSAETFYRELLGFDRMLSWDSASFLSAGGYHHHLGVNTWGTLGAPPPPPDSIGLRDFTIQLPSRSDVKAVAARLHTAELDFDEIEEGLLVHDPSHNGILITAVK